nr:uncharacterized protein LOC129386571 isoform X1 [Dermacentor andersoni]
MTTIKYFNFAVLLALFTVANALNIEVLRKGLNTTEKVWLKKRSYNISNDQCIYASKMFLNQTDYEFEVHYEMGDKKVLHQLLAKLEGGEGEEDPWMIVSSLEGGTGLQYTLKFASDQEKCGVLTHNFGGKDQCEMYVWDQTIDATLTECENKYNELCQESHAVYSSDCKTKSA